MGVPDSAYGFGPLGGFRELIEEDFCVEGVHELRRDTIVVGVGPEQVTTESADPLQHRFVIFRK